MLMLTTNIGSMIIYSKVRYLHALLSEIFFRRRQLGNHRGYSFHINNCRSHCNNKEKDMQLDRLRALR